MQQPVFDAEILQSVAALIVASLVVMGSPGPATISVTALGGAFGVKRALPYLTGIILGTSLVLCAVAAGLASLLVSQPRLAPVLLALSTGYILYLAYKIALAPPLSGAATQADAPAFLGGLLLAVANPKAYVAIAAVFAGTRLGLSSELSETLAKIAILTAMIVLIHWAWLIGGTLFAGLLRQPTISRLVNLAFAALLVLSTAMAILPMIR
jgi:threonine/homoserine/homoserine lactone efflux protein